MVVLLYHLPLCEQLSDLQPSRSKLKAKICMHMTFKLQQFALHMEADKSIVIINFGIALLQPKISSEDAVLTTFRIYVPTSQS